MSDRPPDPTPIRDPDDTRWLALLLRRGCLVIVAGVEQRYGLARSCPRCGTDLPRGT